MTGGELPDEPGYYWAKLIKPSGMPKQDDWRSIDWEIVHVVMNDARGQSPSERFAVFIPGVAPMQQIDDLEWGPRIAEHPPS
ncbi:hypothetical protein GJW-30_1_04053 [Variibacter gotjawalensis]|uniref:Uncharacterized protein n=1 Tax=Variibacter gotjawalensis TaxID=1333996 RepID=A0A0S3Q003_9BRAD|nr:hypothetical protein [Variibacter gotjawalensis]NIK47336.1 hypothetical protein [Variibacter gotjawalensis]RZS49234.1 hypothetical protein EV661_1660 [Variibacter gotjawalensis]BAT61496.1 hypothetical protein GJW-30_1_04053 [Variibacter gotjawalensis]